MIYRGALVRVVILGVTFSCRPLRLVRPIARRALRLMKSCDERVSFVVANLALRNRDNQLLESRELTVSRVLCRRTQRRRQERLFVLKRVRVPRRGRIAESNGARRVTLRGRELNPDPSHGMKPRNQILHA